MRVVELLPGTGDKKPKLVRKNRGNNSNPLVSWLPSKLRWKDVRDDEEPPWLKPAEVSSFGKNSISMIDSAKAVKNERTTPEPKIKNNQLSFDQLSTFSWFIGKSGF